MRKIPPELEDPKDSSFVELPSAFAPVAECVIELEDNAGTWRVHLKGYRAADIAAIGRSLRGCDVCGRNFWRG